MFGIRRRCILIEICEGFIDCSCVKINNFIDSVFLSDSFKFWYSGV